MSFMKNQEYKYFKVKSINLNDRMQELLDFIINLHNISLQIIDNKNLKTPSITNEYIYDKKQSIFEDIVTIIQLKCKLPKYGDIVKLVIEAILKYNEVALQYQVLQQQSKYLVSKISISKELFAKCKRMFVQIQLYFYNSSQLLQVLQREQQF
ncbi:hypothetical protein ABPG72_000201 [Tetrahymena utriculariae]